MPQERSIHIYRIVTEIIHNTLKHAAATQLKIDFTRERDNLVLRTADNGRGFNYATQSREQQGLGLRNLLSRTDLLGGNLYIDSAPGKGTHFLIELPLNHQK